MSEFTYTPEEHVNIAAAEASRRAKEVADLALSQARMDHSPYDPDMVDEVPDALISDETRSGDAELLLGGALEKPLTEADRSYFKRAEILAQRGATVQDSINSSDRRIHGE